MDFLRLLIWDWANLVQDTLKLSVGCRTTFDG